MRRLLSILLIISTFNICVNAQEKDVSSYPRFTFGAEWGYVASIWKYSHHNFFSNEGYRMNLEDNAFLFHSNGDLYLHAGCNVNHNWNISLYAGYAGIYDLHKIVPISLRGTRYFGKDALKDRWFAFLDLGSGICIKRPVQEIIAGKIGGGYRISLSRDTKLDLMFSARITYTHPEIIHDGNPVKHEMTNRNDTFCGALSIGMAITL